LKVISAAHNKRVRRVITSVPDIKVSAHCIPLVYTHTHTHTHNEFRKWQKE